jgi:large subunit ribosomal protein L3
MFNGLWGKKIGMTQVFSQDHKVIPVTVIDVANWLITRVKTKERDGYNAVQLGCVKKQFADAEFSSEWIKTPRKYFSSFKEVAIVDESNQFIPGQSADLNLVLAQGDYVDVFGITIGRGFQGGVKRHGFRGGPASHGSKLGRGPGSLSGWRSQGRVRKGKRMAGHMGVDNRVMKNLQVVKIQPDARVILVKGSVPGKTGSLVFVRKRG